MKKISLVLLALLAIGTFVSFHPIDAEAFWKLTENTATLNKITLNRIVLNSDTIGEVTLNDKAFVGLILEK